MNQLRIKNDSIKSFVILTVGRNLNSYVQKSHSLDVSCSFDMTNSKLEFFP